LHWHGHCACVPYHAPHQLGGVELDKWQRRHPRTLTLLLPSTIHLRNDAYSDGDGDRLLDGDWSKLIRGLSIRKERNRRRRNSQTFHRLPALPPHTWYLPIPGAPSLLSTCVLIFVGNWAYYNIKERHRQSGAEYQKPHSTLRGRRRTNVDGGMTNRAPSNTFWHDSTNQKEP
jgi:hypothetical protein